MTYSIDSKFPGFGWTRCPWLGVLCLFSFATTDFRMLVEELEHRHYNIKPRVIETRCPLQHIHNVLVSYRQASILQIFPEED